MPQGESRTKRWAAAFVNAVGSGPETGGKPWGDVEEGLSALKAMVPVTAILAARIAGGLSGENAAKQLDRMLLAAIVKSGPAAGRGLEYAHRLIILLIRRESFRYSAAVVRAIEDLLDQKKGIVTVTVETASALDETFRETLKVTLRQSLGAQELKLITRRVPELLGGCRLRMGGLLLDASLRGQLRQLAADLQAGPSRLAAGPGGYNGTF
jgi:F0F1-type ATP synthase delta subunit